MFLSKLKRNSLLTVDTKRKTFDGYIGAVERWDKKHFATKHKNGLILPVAIIRELNLQSGITDRALLGRNSRVEFKFRCIVYWESRWVSWNNDSKSNKLMKMRYPATRSGKILAEDVTRRQIGRRTVCAWSMWNCIHFFVFNSHSFDMVCNSHDECKAECSEFIVRDAGPVKVKDDRQTPSTACVQCMYAVRIYKNVRIARAQWCWLASTRRLLSTPYPSTSASNGRIKFNFRINNLVAEFQNSVFQDPIPVDISIKTRRITVLSTHIMLPFLPLFAFHVGKERNAFVAINDDNRIANVTQKLNVFVRFDTDADVYWRLCTARLMHCTWHIQWCRSRACSASGWGQCSDAVPKCTAAATAAKIKDRFAFD